MTRRIAVVGSGVAGLLAAHVASRPGNDADVVVYEADDRLGGHADTHDVDGLRIDTGFIVHNRRTYPTLLRLFAELAIETRESEMSLSVRDDATGLEWAGALGPRGLFPTLHTLRHPGYVRMLLEVPRFHRHARRLMRSRGGEVTLRQFLSDGGFSEPFRRHFMEPLVAAVWSCDPAVALDYPARYLFQFLEHHGMLGIFGSPPWRTVVGGSRTYVDRVAAELSEVRLATKVTAVLETPEGVEVTDGNGDIATYDAVVIATHPHQALAMLTSPTPAQREVLGALPYSTNSALLHTDTSLLPSARGARASWNFRRPTDERDHVVVTYDLTRLQGLDTETHYLLTLGADDLVDPGTVIARREYEHPLYTPASVDARRRLPEIHTARVAFAGAYDGWGFHEDGARSGVAAARRLGLAWDESPAQVPTGIFETTIRHTRRQPFRRTFTHRSHTWLVDLDHLPDHGRLGWLRGSFEARDHLGRADRTIRANLEAFLAGHGVDLTGGRVLMAAHPRALGYCFNPITVFWCFDAAGRPAGVVVEVHNTYGDRHAYLVHPDANGRARTDKAMYVSPFHGTDGHYDLAVPLPAQRLDVAVTLRTDDGAVFSASLQGTRSDASPLRAAPQALRGAALIRLHGVWLWLRRLPVRPRPTHHQEHVR